MKKGFLKFIAVVMAVMIAAVYVPVADLGDIFSIEASARTYYSDGKLGGNVKWVYNSDTRVITVSGSGDMKNFSKANDGQGFRNIVTWTTQYPYTHATKVVISEGITNIGNYALADLRAVKSVELPSTVKSIGNNAFEGCTSLTTVNLTESITSIGANAFKNTKFANVNMPYSVKSIGDNAFAGISGLKITCNYGDAAYNYCVKHSSSYTLRQPSFLVDTSIDAATKQMKVSLKIKDGAGLNAANFNLSYSSAVTPVSTSASDTFNENGNSTAVVYNANRTIGIAFMSSDYVTYAQCGATCSYTIVDLLFKISGDADTAEFTVSPSVMLCLNSRVAPSALTVKASLHSYSEAGSGTASTCKTEGVITHTCDICGKKITESTPLDPNNHEGGTEIRDAIAATCNDTGYSGDTYCLGCNKMLEVGSVTEITNHDYTVTVVAPTCTENGYTKHVCSLCNDTFTDNATPAVGHNYEAVSVAATCTEQGYTRYTCTRCNDNYTSGRVRPLGHDYDATGKCKRCGDVTVLGISFVAGSDLVADETTATVVSKAPMKVSELISQIAATGWTVKTADGSTASADAAAATGFEIVNDATGKTYTFILMGDVDANGKVNASDARVALRISSKLDTAEGARFSAADIDGNGKVSASDARKILRYSAKLDAVLGG